MKQYRILPIIFLLLFFFITGTVQGYIITIDAPAEVVKGIPLVVTGSTTFPEDSYFDIVLFYSKYTAGEVARSNVIVDKTQQFRVDFDTKDLEKGQYKVEVHDIYSDNEKFVEQELGSSSIVTRVVQITDRSDEITITSPENQPLDQALTISGRMKDMGDGVLTLRVFGPEQYTHGPEQIITTKGYADNSGEFSTTVPVPSPGNYQASFSDKNGYIGEYEFVVTGLTPEETPIPTTEQTPLQTSTPPVQETPVTPSPIPTQSSPEVMGIIIGIIGIILYSGRKK